jgi:hypothetical protein
VLTAGVGDEGQDTKKRRIKHKSYKKGRRKKSKGDSEHTRQDEQIKKGV